MLNTLSGRFLILTTVFVMLAEVLIFVPSVARFREDYLLDRLERAQIASLALLADDMLEMELEAELLKNAEVYNVVLRRDEMRQLVLSSPIPKPISQTYDLRDPGALVLIRDAMLRLFRPGNDLIRVIGAPGSATSSRISASSPWTVATERTCEPRRNRSTSRDTASFWLTAASRPMDWEMGM